MWVPPHFAWKPTLAALQAYSPQQGVPTEECPISRLVLPRRRHLRLPGRPASAARHHERCGRVHILDGLFRNLRQQLPGDADDPVRLRPQAVRLQRIQRRPFGGGDVGGRHRLARRPSGRRNPGSCSGSARARPRRGGSCRHGRRNAGHRPPARIPPSVPAAPLPRRSRRGPGRRRARSSFPGSAACRAGTAAHGRP